MQENLSFFSPFSWFKKQGYWIWSCVTERTEKRFGKGGRLNTFTLVVLVNSVLDSAYICDVSIPFTCKTQRLDSVRQQSLWSWYNNTEQAFWREVINHKYGQQGWWWCTNPVRSAFGVVMWRSIGAHQFIFATNIGYKEGDGRNLEL